tara:strand:- start:425 stop:925 length:501 start_codon:yes stop_codon:yes gene_type:complete
MKDKYHFFINNEIHKIDLPAGFDFFYFSPSFFQRKLHKGLYFHSNFLYVFWFIFTLGRYHILYIRDKASGEIAHFSNILPDIFKYSFMKKGDVQILNCWTYKRYRGMRLYPFALSKIQEKFHDRNILIGSKISNTASLNAIKRAGFKKIFDVEKRTIFGIYYKIDE